MKLGSYSINLLIKISFFLIFSQQAFSEQAKTQLPMYGNEDRGKNPDFIAQDDELIKKATTTFGTREHASEGYVEHGFDHYSSNELNKSMNRFNQAWLLNPENPYPYLGFALLLNKQEQSCDAYKMFKLANKKGINENGFLADYAYTTSQCASLKKDNERKKLFNVANTLYEKAIQTPNTRLLAYVYHSWAKSYYLQGDFIKSNEMIEQSRKLGGTIDSSLLQALEKKHNN